MVTREDDSDSKEDIAAEIIRIKRGENERDIEGIKKLEECFITIKKTLEKYIDMKEEYYDLITIWIIGTYFHKQFQSYPYLFLNAMRGSGKTRTLKLITTLAKDGILMASPTEAVLFRTTGTLGIDEFESVASKEKSSIRELLNASYKKGTKIMRLKKKKTLSGEEMVVEEFEPYRPIVLANIWGMEEVLQDRCISIILEKSDHPVKTRLIEDYSECEIVSKLKNDLNLVYSVYSVYLSENVSKKWNNYLVDYYSSTLNTYTTHSTLTTLNTPSSRVLLENIKLDEIFYKINNTGIYGRNLELFLPLFLLSRIFGEEVFEKMLIIAKEIINQRKDDEEVESKDVMVLDFISKQEEGLIWFSVKELTNKFKEFIGYEFESNDNWCNNQWFGKALKRLSLIIDKRRVSKGNDVMLNVSKAKEKLKMFRTEDKNET